MTWDLAQIVEGASPEEIRSGLENVINDAEAFSKVYFDRIESMSPKELNRFLKEFERLFVRLMDLGLYCKLSFDADSTDPTAGQLRQWSDQIRVKYEQIMAPVHIVLGKRIHENPSIAEDSALHQYKHYLEKMAAKAPFKLSEEEEKLVQMKDINGISLIQQLRNSWISEKSFEIEVDGVTKSVPYSTLSALRISTNREVRKKASYTLYKMFHDEKTLYAYALRSICTDHVSMSRLRKEPSTMTQSFLAQDVDENTIESLLTAIEGTIEQYHEFLELKAKTMGLEKLAGYDVIAPIITESSWSFDWTEAKSLAIEAFASFDEEFGSIVKDMFNGKRVDAANRKGKRPGAFCAPWYDKKKCFVHTTYNGTYTELSVLAHELGHAVQGHYAFRDQSALNRSPGSCLAEMGSVFGELLLAEEMLDKSETKEQRIEILGDLLSRYFYVVHYVCIRVIFEKNIYQYIEEGKLIDADTACELWKDARYKIFGDSVDWDEAEYMEYEWARIPHFYKANFRFYNYSYSFAQMLVFALYEAYKEGGPEFAERFKTLLGIGGSMSPHDQLLEFGYNIADPSFWELGAKQADRFLKELRELL
jgi:oligoendopeptidase F